MSKYIFNNDTDILEFLEQLRENVPFLRWENIRKDKCFTCRF